jgi:hypothetical protein
MLALFAGWDGPGPARAGGVETVEEHLWDLQIVPLEGAAPAPFTLGGLDQPARSLGAARGRVVLLYFWASW